MARRAYGAGTAEGSCVDPPRWQMHPRGYRVDVPDSLRSVECIVLRNLYSWGWGGERTRTEKMQPCTTSSPNAEAGGPSSRASTRRTPRKPRTPLPQPKSNRPPCSCWTFPQTCCPWCTLARPLQQRSRAAKVSAPATSRQPHHQQPLPTRAAMPVDYSKWASPPSPFSKPPL